MAALHMIFKEFLYKHKEDLCVVFIHQKQHKSSDIHFTIMNEPNKKKEMCVCVCVCVCIKRERNHGDWTQEFVHARQELTTH
jgi:hypothetical protein